MNDAEELLDEQSVVPYLAGRGVVDGTRATAQLLGGGVSNVVLAVTDRSRRLVLKQARAKLAVAEAWFAPRERVLREAEGLRVLSGIDPDAAPAVVDLDSEALTMTMEQAPDDWTDWKTRLLAGDVDPAIAAQLGGSLSRMHQATRGGSGLSAELVADVETFDVLRIEPYHRTAARRNPDLATAIDDVVERMRDTRQCLVHGDFSPKNILVGDGGAWIIDFEVAHLGDPSFDVAFLETHLLLKTIHAPERRDAFAEASRAFLDAYTRDTPIPDAAHLSRQIGCLLLARVDGKSPAEYLRAPEQRRAHELGRTLLLEAPDAPETAWTLMEQETE
ncbi:phosphotransferase family protein [Microbacterium sp. AK031]|uniref:phosphotransferase family protein n=1 Tax=Microbacterium sp. AK031 TaxID=2723076 RepID=UPI002166CE99|nr:aminoglycoside phosphotransferase family protein [Microbacterium sp. AK031]MCS3844071.1 5-methylthioribose kinase [Microbacterium sp. AK031]